VLFVPFVEENSVIALTLHSGLSFF